MKRKFQVIFMIMVSLIPILVLAKDRVDTNQVHFKQGKTSITLKGDVKGYNTVLYKLSVKAGQILEVKIQSKYANFNIYVPGKGLGEEGMFRGEPGIPYRGQLPTDGVYTIAVYMMRNEARRGTDASYTLYIGVK